ncbi:MAG TPA: SET domain-containing protein, partial [Halioglobus sp.]
MIHPDTRLVTIDGVVGSGVIATRRIPRGTITWVMDELDRTFTGDEMNALPARYDELLDRWTFHDGRGHRVLCWDLGRYMNHSCEPNCGGSEYWFEVALRDIEPGEQLTNDYATLYMRPSEGFECRCGAPTCRGSASDAAVPHAVAKIRNQLRHALSELGLVAQPLSELLHTDWLARAQELLAPQLDYPVEAADAVPPPRLPGRGRRSRVTRLSPAAS